jgi:hypothetical protein
MDASGWSDVQRTDDANNTLKRLFHLQKDHFAALKLSEEC